MHDRIDSRQAARFVADGLLRFDALVPDQLNRDVLAELRSERLTACRYNDARVGFDEYFADSPAYLAVLRLPQVQAAIAGLVGPEPEIDHCAVHTVPAGSRHAQVWHADATIDPRTEAFDIQIFYFPHDTPREAGGTLFLPSSHFRRVHEFSIGRYHNIVGQTPTVCPAGTIIIGHHGLWHCGQPNLTASTRYMVKLRLNPTVRQCGLFDRSDIDHPDVMSALQSHHRWHGVEARLEILQRLRLWRSLTGTNADVDLWLTRLENEPTRSLSMAHAAG
ncbi:MAG: phytanoyl-CoA dioxygenase family protein [Planctomycetes bacterium]|nr:phytanoyl-CoA dioxygenase family protein [Planctomycetota bacterium]